MVLRRRRRGICLVATNESATHKPAGCQRFDGHERTAAANRRNAALGVLRLSFQRNTLAVVFARRANIVADRERREGRP